MTDSRNKVPPRMIIHDGNIFTSIKQIANIANEFYIEKVKIIRKSSLFLHPKLKI